MSKKILMSLAPLFAVAAFAILPATSQAAYHWYVGGTRLPFTSAKTEVSSYGKLTLEVPAAALTVKCNVLNEGNIWNTVLAEVGKDEITNFLNNKCTSTPACTGVLTVTAEGLPWPTELSAAAPAKDKITGIKVKVVCTAPALSETFSGSLEPAYVNGTPSYAEFKGAESGHLTGPTLGEATVKGKVFIAVTETAANVTVANP